MVKKINMMTGGSPRLLKCFSGIEGGVNMLLLLLPQKMTMLKVGRKIKVYRHIHSPASHYSATWIEYSTIVFCGKEISLTIWR